MGLCSKVVHLIGFDLAQQRDEAGTVAEVAVVKEKPGVIVMGIHIHVVDPGSIEG
ncbi:hypothetical protein D9M69_734990 [compost metagenome]